MRGHGRAAARDQLPISGSRGRNREDSAAIRPHDGLSYAPSDSEQLAIEFEIPVLAHADVNLADRRHDCGAVEHDAGIAWHLTVYEHGQAQQQRDRVGDSSAYQ